MRRLSRSEYTKESNTQRRRNDGFTCVYKRYSDYALWAPVTTCVAMNVKNTAVAAITSRWNSS